MFERFTDRARRVVVIAQEEARDFGHRNIGTEHLLLGLIHADADIGAKALASFELTQDGIRTKVEEVFGRGDWVSSGHVPFTPRAKKVLELSLREALQLGDNYIGSQHILLGLIREADGRAIEVLKLHDVDLNKLRKEVIRLISGGEFPPPPPRPLSEIREELQGIARQLLQAATISSTPDGELLRVIQECSAQLGKSKRELERYW